MPANKVGQQRPLIDPRFNQPGPGWSGALVLKAWLHYARGDLAPAIEGAWLALAVDHDQPDALTPLTVCLPGMLHAMEGRFKEAVEPYRDMLAGNVARATHWLAVAVDRGLANYPYISKHSPFFCALPENDALRTLKARIQERWASFQKAD